MTRNMRAVLAIAWLGVSALMVGTCYRKAHADVLRASSTTSWPVAVYSVAGVEMSAAPVQTRQADGTYLITLDIPALVPPYGVSLRVVAADGRVFHAVLPDGRPGPLVRLPANGCASDVNADGGVGLDDVGLTFVRAAQGLACP